MGTPKRQPIETSSQTSGVYPCKSTEAHAGPAMVEVGLAPRSASNLYGDFEEKVRGVFVATYALLPLEAPVTLSLHLPGGVHRVLGAVVEWRRDQGEQGEQADPLAECGMGVRFEPAVDAGTRDLLETFAVWRAPLFYA